MPLHLTGGDLAVIFAVSIQATVLAYVGQHKWKAIILSLPIPFTFMTFASGRPVDATTVLGVDLFFFFMQTVRWLHQDRRVPIIPAIVVAALGYCAIGAGLAAVLPRTAASYWLATIGTFAFGVVMFRLLPYRAEPAHRSELPVWIKWPIITVVVLFLVSSRGVLQGFATVFPIMGTMSCYEARHSLWTVGRQAAVIAMILAVTLIGPYLAWPHIGMVPSLVLAWIIWAALFLPVTFWQWSHVPPAPLPNAVSST
jgi:hypothetical protein